MIYLDANATARLRPEAQLVLNEMLLANGPRNPSSVHQAGRIARSRLQSARRSVLDLLSPAAETRGQRLVFTSGGTEACNQLMLGFLGNPADLSRSPSSIVLSSIEHPAVLEPAAMLERAGWTVKRISPGPDGFVRVSDFLAAVEDNTAVVSLMAANNETGAIQPIVELARSLRAIGYRGPIVSDFTQIPGKSSLSASELFEAGVNGIAVSGHKLGAPSGIGAIVLSEGKGDICFMMEPILKGGAQENGNRAGTENTFGAYVFGEVAHVLLETLEADLTERRRLRDILWDELRKSLPGVDRLTPRENDRRMLANTLSLRFIGCRGDDLIVALDLEGVCASTGSACSSGKQAVSHVITALGLAPEEAREVVRFSVDWDTSEEDIRRAALIITKVVNKMRGKGVTAELAKAA